MLLVLFTSCKDEKASFPNKNLIVDKIESESILDQNIIQPNNKSNSNIETKVARHDSLLKIYAYNSQVRKSYIEFCRNTNYLPSSKYNHLEHIRKYSTIEGIDDKIYKPKLFIDYVIKNCLEDPSHKKYLTDRKLLYKLKNGMCDVGFVSIVDTLKNGKNISIKLRSREIESENYKIDIDDKDNYISNINGKYPFGAIYYNNSIEEIIELHELEISVEGKNIETNKKEYMNLYNPNFCNFGIHKRIAEAYSDGNNIYIYIFGGNNAGSYFAKLIFNIDSGYIGKIVTDYAPLSIYGSFHENFIGY